MITNVDRCEVCGAVLDDSLGDLGCPTCLLRAGIGHSTPVEQAQQFGPFTIERCPDGSLDELGRGAMGITYRAVDRSLNRPVALKTIDPRQNGSDQTRGRFMREARAAAGLRHPNIAAVHHFGVNEESGHYFYAMELVEGETLEERIRRTGPLPWREAVAIAEQVAAALIAAEERGLVHRDLKPGNIMLAAGKEGMPEVKVIDFGLAKAIAEQPDAMMVTHDGFVGSPAFASPEQFARGPLDIRSDIYSLGVTLWFALTGKMPFAGESIEAIQAAQRSGRLPLGQLKAAHVPPRLIALLRRMLSLEPAARPGTRELAAQLRASARTSRRLALALTAAVLVSALGVTFYFNRPHPESATMGTTNAAAREAYLKARYLWNRRNSADFQDTKTYFEQAVALDPNYAQAYAGLADLYHLSANSDRKVRADYYTKAKRFAQRAMEINPNLAEAHASLGLIAMNGEWDWPAAEREFKKAVTLDPNYATAHQWYASYLAVHGRFDEALREIREAHRLDPLSGAINNHMGEIFIYARRYKEAEEKLKETIKLAPAFDQAHTLLARIYAMQGRIDEAMAEIKVLKASEDSMFTWAEEGYVDCFAGRLQEAEEQLRRVQEATASNGDTSHLPLLILNLGLGRIDDALVALEDEYRAHSTAVTSLRVNPLFDPLRREPRFARVRLQIFPDAP